MKSGSIPVNELTDDDVAFIKRCTESAIDTWKDRLWLQDWEIWVVYSRKDPAAREPDDDDNFYFSLMRITPKWAYRTAEIQVDMPMINGKSADDIEALVVHELIHCIVAPIAPEDFVTRDQTHAERNLEEYVVTNLTRAFLTVSGHTSQQGTTRFFQEGQHDQRPQEELRGTTVTNAESSREPGSAETQITTGSRTGDDLGVDAGTRSGPERNDPSNRREDGLRANDDPGTWSPADPGASPDTGSRGHQEVESSSGRGPGHGRVRDVHGGMAGMIPPHNPPQVPGTRVPSPSDQNQTIWCTKCGARTGPMSNLQCFIETATGKPYCQAHRTDDMIPLE